MTFKLIRDVTDVGYDTWTYVVLHKALQSPFTGD